MCLLILAQNSIHILLWWNMNAVSNSYQFISQVVVGRVHNVLDFEVNLNIMHVFWWNISSNDDIIHMCWYVFISLIPVEGSSGWTAMRMSMQVYFWHRHVQDTAAILEEGYTPHPWCPLCNILEQWRALNRMHRRTARCRKRVEWNRRCLAAEEEM